MTLPGADAPLVFSYFQNDALDTIDHPSGLIADLEYHPHGPLDTITVAGTSELLKLDYTPDALLNVAAIAETWNGSGVGGRDTPPLRGHELCAPRPSAACRGRRG